MPRPVHRASISSERHQDQRSILLPQRRDGLDEQPSLDFLLVEYATDPAPGGISTSYPHTLATQYIYSTSSLSPPSSSRKNFDGLPQELKVKIFQLLLSPYNTCSTRLIAKHRGRLLQVSSGIRKLVIETPTLWRHISISGPQTNHAYIKQCLKLAKDSGLWWVFDLRNHLVQRSSTPVAETWCTPAVVDSLFATYLHPKMPKTTHIHIIVDSPSLFPVVIAKLQREPAPILRELKLVKGDMYYSPAGLYDPVNHQNWVIQEEDPLFKGDAPGLALVQIHHAPDLLAHSILKGLTHLTRPNIQYLDLSMQRTIHIETFYGLLDAIADNLDTLVLRNAGPAFGRVIGTAATSTAPHSTYLPSLKRLVVGKMTSIYLKRLLSTLSLHPLISLGLHGISAHECEATWDVLLRHVSGPPLSLDRDSSSSQPVRVFGCIEKLELFDMVPSTKMKEPQSSRDDANEIDTLDFPSWRRNAFSEFLAGSPLLTDVRMRRVGMEFVKALTAIPASPIHSSLNLPTPLIPAPALERLEVSCAIRLDQKSGDESSDEASSEDEEDIIPVKLEELALAMVGVLRSRNRTSHTSSIQQDAGTGIPYHISGIRRLHLDGEEWKSRHDPGNAALNEALAELGAAEGAPAGELTWIPPRKEKPGEEGHIPVIQWDARAPFFADYYDSTEV